MASPPASWYFSYKVSQDLSSVENGVSQESRGRCRAVMGSFTRREERTLTASPLSSVIQPHIWRSIICTPLLASTSLKCNVSLEGSKRGSSQNKFHWNGNYSSLHKVFLFLSFFVSLSLSYIVQLFSVLAVSLRQALGHSKYFLW